MAATVKSSTVQALEAPNTLISARAVTKQLILGKPEITTVKSSTVQVLEAPIPGSLVQAVTKLLILEPVTSVEASQVSVEVLSKSTITPQEFGQRVVRFFN